MSSKFLSACALVALLLIAACADNGTRIETGGTERVNARLDAAAPILITTPRDGSYGRRIYQGSGALVARTIDASFSRHARIVDVSPLEYHSLGDLRAAIAQNGYGYIVVPTIMGWSQKNTDWSKTRDQVSVRILVIDAATGRKLSADYLEAKASQEPTIYNWFNPQPQPPEELLSALADDYTDSLYGSGTY